MSIGVSLGGGRPLSIVGIQGEWWKFEIWHAILSFDLSEPDTAPHNYVETENHICLIIRWHLFLQNPEFGTEMGWGVKNSILFDVKNILWQTP